SPGASATVLLDLGGGAPPFSVAWTLNGTEFPMREVTSFPFLVRGPGDYRFQAWVTDRFGDPANASVVLVSAVGSPVPSGGIGPALEWGFAVGALAVAVMAIGLLYRRHRRARRGEARGEPALAAGP